MILKRNFLLLLFLCISLSAVSKGTIDSLKHLLRTSDDTAKISILIKLSEELIDSDPDKAEEYLSIALIESRRSGEQKREADCYAMLGQLHWSQSRYDGAIAQYRHAINIYRQIKDQRGLASSTGDLGVVYRYKGDYVTALEYYMKALNIYESLKDKDGIGTYLNNIARIYETQKEYEKALKMYDQALEIFLSINNKNGVATIYNNKGIIYDKQELYDKALESYLKSVEIAVENKDTPSESNAYNNIGQIFKKKNDYKKALEYFNKSLAIKKTIGDKRGTARIFYNMAAIYRNQHNYKKAEDFIETGLILSRQAKTKEMIAEGYASLALVYSDKKEFKKAYEYYRESVAIRDSVFTEKSNRELIAIQALYESTEKEKTIELLEKEKQIQSLKLSRQKTELSKEKILRYTFTAGVIMLLVFASMLWNRYKIKRDANTLLEKQKSQIEKQKTIVEDQHKNIMDSIHYAKRIQDAILPPERKWDKLLPDSFVYYKPKDVIGGDFYYIETTGHTTIVASVDCTGHGVPGALMSIVGYNLLNKAVLEKGLTDPADILNAVNEWLAQTLHNNEDENALSDGMDIAICSINRSNNIMSYAGAFNPLYCYRDNELIVIKGNRFPLGRFLNNTLNQFESVTFSIEPNDRFYIFSDGYVSQFGGPKGKKLMTGKFKAILKEIYSLPFAEQKQHLAKRMAEWKNTQEQVDDMLVIGFSV